jgi:hypothetical protein
VLKQAVLIHFRAICIVPSHEPKLEEPIHNYGVFKGNTRYRLIIISGALRGSLTGMVIILKIIMFLRMMHGSMLWLDCANIFHCIIRCVMGAEAHFCRSIEPHFFLSDPSQSEDNQNDDNLLIWHLLR